MALQSNIFTGNQRLQQCATQDPAHVTIGDIGSHVGLIQNALQLIDGLDIDLSERTAERYGPSTASAVLNYKTKRRIINPAYQSTPDNIVGKMTIASLDRDMLSKQEVTPPTTGNLCNVRGLLPPKATAKSTTPPGFTLKIR